MVRLIKRYGGGSRKLYDTEESRYVSLEEIAAWIRRGQQLRVVDSTSGEDVTAPTLAQVIYESSKAGRSPLSADLLHEAIRRGGRAITRRFERLQQGVDRLVQQSVARFPPAREARAELEELRRSLAELERAIARLEPRQRGRGAAARRSRHPRAAAQLRAAQRSTNTRRDNAA